MKSEIFHKSTFPAYNVHITNFTSKRETILSTINIVEQLLRYDQLSPNYIVEQLLRFGLFVQLLVERLNCDDPCGAIS